MSFQPDQLELLLWTGRTSRRRIRLEETESLTASGLAAPTFGGRAEQVSTSQRPRLQFALTCFSLNVSQQDSTQDVATSWSLGYLLGLLK